MAGHPRIEDRLREIYGRERFSSWFYTAFAITALVITLAGVTGVVSFVMGARMRELGIRVAVGAPPRRLGRDLLLGVAGLAGIAVLASLPLTWLLVSALRAYFVGVGDVSIDSLLWPALLLLGAALLAAPSEPVCTRRSGPR